MCPWTQSHQAKVLRAKVFIWIGPQGQTWTRVGVYLRAECNVRCLGRSGAPSASLHVSTARRPSCLLLHTAPLLTSNETVPFTREPVCSISFQTRVKYNARPILGLVSCSGNMKPGVADNGRRLLRWLTLTANSMGTSRLT